MGYNYKNVIIVYTLLGTVTAYITWIAVRLPLEGTVAAPGAPWPKPKVWHNSSTVRTLDPAVFIMTSSVSGCDILDQAKERYRSIIMLDLDGVSDPDLDIVSQLVITMTDTECAPEHYPDIGMSEAYTLTVPDSEDATLEATTIWGVLRGLETFSQLIYLTDDKKYQINQTHIEDEPRFGYRGLMLDTARHFLPMDIIISALDAMSWDKFNVLHWHVVDDQSFPYPSRIYPELQEKGAYSANHIYTRNDVTRIIEEARLRGIAVIPEFDTPGHTWSWGQAFPDLITPCWGEGLEGGPEVPNYPIHGAREVVNPMEEFTYQFLDNFYQEVVEDFPNNYVHLGMDEAYYACWESNPNISAWMEEMNFTETSEVEQYYSRRVIDIVENKGSDYIMWQDPIDNGVMVQPSTLVEVWKKDPWQEHLLRVVSQGYDAILSSPWYLNYIAYGEDWKDFYNAEPHNFTDNEEYWAKVKGGEVCIWAEYVDGTNILGRLWPRASAVAERLWSPKTEIDVESAKFRLDQQRCRYVRRGIPAQPILNGYCGDYEWTGVKAPETEPVGGSNTPLPGVMSLMCTAILSILIQYHFNI